MTKVFADPADSLGKPKTQEDLVKTKAQVIDQIRRRPAETLEDIESLKYEISLMSIELSQFRKQAKFWNGMALKYFEMWRAAEKERLLKVRQAAARN